MEDEIGEWETESVGERAHEDSIFDVTTMPEWVGKPASRPYDTGEVISAS